MRTLLIQSYAFLNFLIYYFFLYFLGKDNVSTKRVQENFLILVILRKPGQSFLWPNQILRKYWPRRRRKPITRQIPVPTGEGINRIYDWVPGKKRKNAGVRNRVFPVAEFIDLWFADKVNSGIGLSYRSASPCSWRAGTTTLFRSWLYPPFRYLWNWLLTAPPPRPLSVQTT